MDVRVAGLGEAAAPGGAGVVDQQREPVVALLDLGEDPGGRIGFGQVGSDVGRATGQRLGQRPQPLLSSRDEDQLGAGLTG